MRKSWLLTLGIAAILPLVSCSSLTKTAQYEGVDVQVHSVTVADLDVKNEKVTKSAEWKWNLLKPFSVEEGKKNVMADLLHEQNADVLVEPEFTITRRGFMRGGTVTVTGFPATYTGFHPMTPEEANAINPREKKVITTPIPAAGNLMTAAPQKKSRISDPKQRHHMINILGGWVPKSDHVAGGQWGLMYGNYKNHWGWYVKVLVPYAEMKDLPKGVKSSGYEANISITAGAIWRPSNNWLFNFGTGFAPAFEGYRSLNKAYVNAEAALPIDLAVNWRCYGPLNVMFGLQAILPYDTGYTSAYPYLGVGVTF